jgi:DNA-binding transcriptional MerR regulator
MKSLFTPKDVEQIVGLSYRQIQYWDSSGFIRPSYRRRGRYRCYTFGDLILLEVAHQQRQAGLSVQRLRVLIGSLSRLIRQAFVSDQADLTFLIEGEKILVFTGEMLTNREPSRRSFEFRVRDLAARVRELFPDSDDAFESRKLVG